MFSFVISVEIAAPASRVWRALCDPAEVVRWDTGVAAALDAPADYPRPGQHVRWRYANGPFRILHDRPIEVVPDERLRALLKVGPLSLDEAYILEPVSGGTTLTAWMRLRAPIWIGGVLLERFYAGPATRSTVTASLAAIKRHCESG